MHQLNTKDKIIQEARKIFAIKGFQGATIAEIASKAEISEGAIYRHFRSKEELLMQCVKPVLNQIIDSIEHEFPEVNNIRDFMKKTLEIRMKLFQKHYYTFRILINELPYSREMVNQYMLFLSKHEEKVSKMLDRVKDTGQIKRTRNSLLFGIGQMMSLWIYMNFKEWSKDEDLVLPDEILKMDGENVIDDLTDYILYGISGVAEDQEL